MNRFKYSPRINSYIINESIKIINESTNIINESINLISESINIMIITSQQLEHKIKIKPLLDSQDVQLLAQQPLRCRWHLGASKPLPNRHQQTPERRRFSQDQPPDLNTLPPPLQQAFKIHRPLYDTIFKVIFVMI